jgi:hypothetical protein
MCGRIRREGIIRTIGVIVLLATAAILSFAGSAGAVPLDYTFNTNNQGWQQSQDNGKTIGPAGFSSSGGNPGGRLTAKDDPRTGGEDGCSTGTDPCNLLTFYSPFINEKLGANYGGSASFDLRSSVTPQFGAEFFLLPHGPDYLDGVIPTDAASGYHTLSIRLDETAKWKVCPYAGGSCTTPTQAVFQSLIADSDEVAVMVDVGPDMTGETYDLDNVTLTDGGPPPPPPPPTPPPPNQTKKKKCKKPGKRAAAAKKGKCKKKPRAAKTALRG